MNITLYVSPHLDDVVFSCAGRVLQDISNGNRVIVATVFSKGGSSPAAKKIYAARRKEDDRALRSLGARPVRFGFLDAPFRRRYYHSMRRIILGLHPGDHALPVRIGRRLRSLIRKIKPDAIYGPLAVGAHVDHRLVHAALRSCADEIPLVYYEDRPYSLVRYTVRGRLAQLGVLPSSPEAPRDFKPLSSPLLKKRFCRSLRQSPFMRTLDPQQQKELENQFAKNLAARRPSRGGFFTPVVHGYTFPTVRRIELALRCYQSQLPALLGSAPRYLEQVRELGAWLGMASDYFERFWRPDS